MATVGKYRPLHSWWPGPRRPCDACGLPFLPSPGSSLVCRPCQTIRALTERSGDRGLDMSAAACDDPSA
jgi:hypothetical protein